MPEEQVAAAPVDVQPSSSQVDGGNNAAQPENVATENIDVQNQESNTKAEEQNIDNAFAKAIQSSIDTTKQRTEDNVQSVLDSDGNESAEPDSQQLDSQDGQQGNQEPQDNGNEDNRDGEYNQFYEQQQLRQDTQQISKWIDNTSHSEAVAELNKLGDLGRFIDRNGKSTLKVWDLTTRDEHGETIWINPFNSNEPFTEMKDAKEALVNFNDYLETQYNRAKANSHDAWVERYKPNIKMRAFTPRFNSMSKLAQEMFMEEAKNQNALVYNKIGKLIGFATSFNMESTANRIENFIERIETNASTLRSNGQVVNREQNNIPAQPAVDTPTNNVQAQPDNQNNKPSKTIEEAFAKAVKNQINKKRGGK